MSFSIQFLTKDNVSDYADLRLKSYQDDPYAFSESYEDEKLKPISDFEAELILQGDPPEQYMLGAYDDQDNLVGFVKFRRDRRSKARHKSMIHAMYVDPSVRSHGVGKLLVDKVIELALAQSGLEQIHLWVLHSEKSKSAAAFYRRCGFVSQGPKVNQDLKVGDTYIDAEYMVYYISRKED